MLITFKTAASSSLKRKQFIVYDEGSDRAISFQGNQLEIWGTTNDPLILPYNIDEWYILFVQWIFMADMKGYVYMMIEVLLTTSKTLTTQISKAVKDLDNVYIELYTKGMSPIEKIFSESLRTIRMQD